MEEKLDTIVILPYSKAHILKMYLEAKGIVCDLENLNLVEETTSFLMSFKVLGKDVQNVMPV